MFCFKFFYNIELIRITQKFQCIQWKYSYWLIVAESSSSSSSKLKLFVDMFWPLFHNLFSSPWLLVPLGLSFIINLESLASFLHCDKFILSCKQKILASTYMALVFWKCLSHLCNFVYVFSCLSGISFVPSLPRFDHHRG